MAKSYEFIPHSIVHHANGNSLSLQPVELTFTDDSLKFDLSLMIHLQHAFKELSADYFIKLQQFYLRASPNRSLDSYEQLTEFTANVILKDNGSKGASLNISFYRNGVGRFTVSANRNSVRVLMGALLLNNINTIIADIDSSAEQSCIKKKNSFELSVPVILAAEVQTIDDLEID